MMKESSSKAMALLVTLLMIGSVLVTIPLSTPTTATTATKTDVPEATVLPGQKNVVVMKFTVTEAGRDILLNGTAIPGTQGTTTNPWSNVYFYDSSSEGSSDGVWNESTDAIWVDNDGTGGDTDTFDAGGDTLLAGTAPDDGTSGTLTNPWESAAKPICFHDDGDNTWEADSDAIWLDNDGDSGNGAYGDAIKKVTISNVGTADTTDIDAIELYMESNEEPGFQTGEGGDTHIGTFTTSGDVWACDLSSSPITLFGESKTFYVVADISDTPTSGRTLQFKIPSGGINVVSHDTVPRDDLENANVLTIKKLGVDYFEGTEEGAVDVIVTDTKEIKYNATVNIQINTSCLNPLLAGTAPDDGTEGDTSNPWSGIYFYDGGTHGKWEANSDAIWLDKEGGTAGQYDAGIDTLLAGTEPADGTTGTNSNPWSNVRFHNGGTSAWEEDSDAIWLDNGDGKWDHDNVFYLYYPYYKRVGSGGTYSYYIEWKSYHISGGAGGEAAITADGGIHSFQTPIHFNTSGIWILDNDNDPTDAAEGTDTSYFAYFWVNGSEVYDISLSTDKVYYGKNETITITVTEGGSAAGVWIDVRRESDGSLVFHKWAGDGMVTFNSDWLNNLTYAGNYTVFAYRDIDPTIIGYGTYGYSEDYGYSAPPISTENYSAICGPWDPPEKVSAVKKIVVKTGEPTLEIPETNRTMYWGFNGTVKVYTKGYDGKNLTFSWTDVKVYGVYNGEKRDVTSCVYIDANNTGYIEIWPKSGKWGINDTESGDIWGTNGTWEVVVSYDKPTADGTEEWNGTVTFTVTSAPDVQIMIVSPSDKEIEAVPDISHQPVSIWFKVVNREGKYLGEDGEDAAKKNITLSGDLLFVGDDGKTLSEYEDVFPNSVEYKSGNKTWRVALIPLMDINGGEIKIKVNWENTTKEETIQVGGTKLNGTIVTITPSEFTIDENVTLTVKVTDANGYAYPNAHVALYYFNDATGSIMTANPINSTNGGGTTSGEYTFLFNVSQQIDNQTDIFGDAKAPRYIIAYANVSNVGCGYAYAVMKPRSDLKVEVSRDTFMAGKPYHFWINVSTIDPITGNKTGTPDEANLHVEIYNETGANVTSKFKHWEWSHLDGENSIEITSGYALEAGTYTIYAYNNTHDSEGYNATIYVVPVQVTCDKSELILNYDDNISLTFTVKWQGENVGNGTLRIYNISQDGEYYKAWSEGHYKDFTLTNGVVTLHNVTANFLPKGKGLENITFEYKPEGASEFAKAEGILPVKVPDVEPTPSSVALGETATVHVLVTGRGQPLSGVNVTLKGVGIKLNATTGTNGIATFSFLPGSTGFIDILIENRSTGTQIEVTSHSLHIDVKPTVPEGTFTVNVTDENGDPVKDAYVKFTGTGETKRTDASGKVSFEISVSGTIPYVTYKLIATKPGYKSDEKSITIMNKFSLYISAPSKASSGQKIKVKVTSDAGQVYGVKVTLKKGNEVIETKTLTGPEGVSFTLPQVSKETTFTIVAEKEGYETATYDITVTTGGIPGFELVTLIAAIGVAFVLLRRRQQ